MTIPTNRLTRFSNRAADYALHRPSYAPAAIDAILADLGDPATLTAADIGAGTGIASMLLSQRGLTVHAVEPNAPMRQRGLLDSSPRVHWHNATGERAGLPDSSVDLVLCAQAFHWLDANAALAEFRRILRPAGRAAVLWNVTDSADAASLAYMNAVKAHATDPPTSPWFTGISDPFAAARDLWADIRVLRFDNSQTLTHAGLIGRALSASYSPTEGPAHAALLRDLDSIFRAHSTAGQLTLRYTTEVHLAERAP